MSAESTFPIPFTLPFTLGPFLANAAIGNVLGLQMKRKAGREYGTLEARQRFRSRMRKKAQRSLIPLAEMLRIIAILISPVTPKRRMEFSINSIGKWN